MTTQQQRIGELIRTARKEKYMTQEELAKKLNITRDAIFTYEKGKVKVIPFEKRVKLSQILNIPIERLLYSSEDAYEENDMKNFKNLFLKNPLKYQEFVNSLMQYLDDYSLLPENQALQAKLLQDAPLLRQSLLVNEFEFYSYLLNDYDILLTKENNDLYTLTYKTTNEKISFSNEQFLVLKQLLKQAQKEVGRFVFLSLKSSLQSLENVANVNAASKEHSFDKPFDPFKIKGNPICYTDDDQNDPNTKK